MFRKFWKIFKIEVRIFPGKLSRAPQDGAKESEFMARITHSFSHNLERKTARKLVEVAWQHYKNRYSKYHPECNWRGDDLVNIGFRAGFLKLAGDLEITDSEFKLGMDVPMSLRFLRKKAISILETEVNKWLAKSDEIDSA